MTGEEMIRAAEDWIDQNQPEPTEYERGYDDGYREGIKHLNEVLALLENLIKDFPAGVDSAALKAAQKYTEIPF